MELVTELTNFSKATILRIKHVKCVCVCANEGKFVALPVEYDCQDFKLQLYSCLGRLEWERL
jgi:hypothetical protein